MVAEWSHNRAPRIVLLPDSKGPAPRWLAPRSAAVWWAGGLDGRLWSQTCLCHAVPDRGQTTWLLCFRVPGWPLCLSPCLSPSVPTSPTPILSLFPALLVLHSLPFLLLSAPASGGRLPSGHLTVGPSPWLHVGEEPSGTFPALCCGMGALLATSAAAARPRL